MVLRLIRAQAGEEGKTTVTVTTEAAGEAQVPCLAVPVVVVLARKAVTEAVPSTLVPTMVGAAAVVEWAATVLLPASGPQERVVVTGQTHM